MSVTVLTIQLNHNRFNLWLYLIKLNLYLDVKF